MLVYNEVKASFHEECLSVNHWETLGIVGFEILTVVTIKSIVFWGVLYNVVEVH
jgi:hypothetical protein